MTRLTAGFSIFLLSGIISATARPQTRPLSNFDVRDTPAADTAAAATDRQELLRRHRNIQSFLATSGLRSAALRVAPNRFGLPKSMIRDGRPLTQPSTTHSVEIARNFL